VTQEVTVSETVSASETHDIALRVTSNNTVDYAAGTKKGWYLDLKPPSGANRGERVLGAPALFDSRILFASFEPNLGACVTGGATWLTVLDALSGARVSNSAGTWDVSGDENKRDGKVDSQDLVSAGGNDYAPSGMKWDDSINKTPAVISRGDVMDVYTNKGKAVLAGSDDRGRQSWRQLR
jgi:type IV pilus assembly protein PilY1